MNSDVIFTRSIAAASFIGQRIGNCTVSLDAALYRFNNPTLALAVSDAARRGVSIRLLVDQKKHDEDSKTQQLLRSGGFRFRLLNGRQGKGSKMHHKFAILDGLTVLTGSYNWTLESEEENYENLVILRDPNQVEAYRREFELLWEEAGSVGA